MALLTLAALTACRGETAGRAGRATPDPFASLEAGASASPAEQQAAPRWETVTTLTGPGPATVPLSISKDAVQWKAEWSCDAGRIRISTDPPPRKPGPIADETCPKKGDAFAVQTGAVRLIVEATGAWQVIVRQQVTSPLDEPALPEMSAPGARILARGSFFPVEKPGKGTALLYRLGDGLLALRLEDFETSQNSDLFVWASQAEKPTTSETALKTPHVVVAELKSTLGNQNYSIPQELGAGEIRSIVIWCQPVQIAYVATALEPEVG